MREIYSLMTNKISNTQQIWFFLKKVLFCFEFNSSTIHHFKHVIFFVLFTCWSIILSDIYLVYCANSIHCICKLANWFNILDIDISYTCLEKKESKLYIHHKEVSLVLCKMHLVKKKIYNDTLKRRMIK